MDAVFSCLPPQGLVWDFICASGGGNALSGPAYCGELTSEDEDLAWCDQPFACDCDALLFAAFFLGSYDEVNACFEEALARTLTSTVQDSKM